MLRYLNENMPQPSSHPFGCNGYWKLDMKTTNPYQPHTTNPFYRQYLFSRPLADLDNLSFDFLQLKIITLTSCNHMIFSN